MQHPCNAPGTYPTHQRQQYCKVCYANPRRWLQDQSMACHWATSNPHNTYILHIAGVRKAWLLTSSGPTNEQSLWSDMRNKTEDRWIKDVNNRRRPGRRRWCSEEESKDAHASVIRMVDHALDKTDFDQLCSLHDLKRGIATNYHGSNEIGVILISTWYDCILHSSLNHHPHKQ